MLGPRGYRYRSHADVLRPDRVSAADAYKIGCPAVDSALGGGTVVNKVSVTG